MDSHLARLTKINIEKSQITYIRNERRGIITDLMDIKRIIEMPQQLYAWKFDNLDEMHSIPWKIQTVKTHTRII